MLCLEIGYLLCKLNRDLILRSQILRSEFYASVNIINLRYTRLKEVGKYDYFTRFHYDHETGWFSPDIIEVFCKCLLPYNPNEYMLQCHACKDWYHPAYLNMIVDEAKQLADNFICDREQCLDGKKPHNKKLCIC